MAADGFLCSQDYSSLCLFPFDVTAGVLCQAWQWTASIAGRPVLSLNATQSSDVAELKLGAADATFLTPALAGLQRFNADEEIGRRPRGGNDRHAGSIDRLTGAPRNCHHGEVVCPSSG